MGAINGILMGVYAVVIKAHFFQKHSFRNADKYLCLQIFFNFTFIFIKIIFKA